MSDSFFKDMVDELIFFADHDPELKDGIQWLDRLAQKEGVTIYDKVYEVLIKYDTNQRAKEWVKGLNHG